MDAEPLYLLITKVAKQSGSKINYRLISCKSDQNCIDVTATSFQTGTNQLVGLIDCKDTAVDFLPHVDMSISKECNELLAFILHACEGDGNLIIIQMLRQNGQQPRLDHTGHHLTLLQRNGEEKKEKKKKPGSEHTKATVSVLLTAYILKKYMNCGGSQLLVARRSIIKKANNSSYTKYLYIQYSIAWKM